MKVKQINFNDDQEPKSVVVEMSVGEAAFVTKAIGEMNDHRAEQIVPGGGKVHNDIYLAFSSWFFNLLWEGGVNDIKDVG